MTITVLGTDGRKEKELSVMMLQTCKQVSVSCSPGFWVIADEIIIMIRNLELHQTNYFENVLDFPTSFGEQQSRTTI